MAIPIRGDLNFTSKSDLRFAREERWGGVLQECLGPECCVLEEGLGGRTTSLEDPAAPGRSGLALLAPIAGPGAFREPTI